MASRCFNLSRFVGLKLRRSFNALAHNCSWAMINNFVGPNLSYPPLYLEALRGCLLLFFFGLTGLNIK